MLKDKNILNLPTLLITKLQPYSSVSSDICPSAMFDFIHPEFRMWNMGSEQYLE